MRGMNAWRIAGLLLAMAPLSGCRDTVEPAAVAAAAPRRDLTEAEKQAIAHAVAAKMKAADAAQFMWPALIVKKRDGVTDYCGLVSGKGAHGADAGFNKYYVQLTFDDAEKISAVSVRAMGAGDDMSQDIADSLCLHYGYGDLSAAK